MVTASISQFPTCNSQTFKDWKLKIKNTKHQLSAIPYAELVAKPEEGR